MNGVKGLEAWRWLFIIEGAPSCACSILVFLFFPDFPETVKWLSDEERELAVERIQGVASLGHAKITWKEARETLTDWRLYLHYLIFMSIDVPFASISLFAPTIISGLGYEGLNAQLFTVPPYAIAFVVTLLLAWQTDKHNVRAWGIVLALGIAGVSFLVQGISCSIHPYSSTSNGRVAKVLYHWTLSKHDTDCYVFPSHSLLRASHQYSAG